MDRDQTSSEPLAAAPSQQSTPAAPAPGPRVYTEDELNERLRGSGKRIKELETAAKELADLKAAKAKDDEEGAKKRGEFERLYAEEKARRETFETEAARHKAAAEAYEDLLQGEVKASIDALPETIRDDAKKSLKGLPLLEQRRIVGLLAKAGGSTTSAAPPAPPPGGGPPGAPRRTPPTARELADNPELAKQAALARLEERRRARGV